LLSAAMARVTAVVTATATTAGTRTVRDAMLAALASVMCASALAPGTAEARPLTTGVAVAATERLPATIRTKHGGEYLSPSRNISCELDWQVRGLQPTAYCQTMVPPRSVSLSAAGVVKKCAGTSCVGNPAENARPLPYMTSAAAGPFLCASRIDGFACSAAGTAFLIAKAGIVTYPVLPHTTMALYRPR
jgi:hypothetical protein